MSNYRNIYEQHYGPISKDKDDRTYDIHHIDGDHKNNLPKNLTAVTIQEHYNIHYKQEDWAACWRMSERMKLSPEEISKLSKQTQIKRISDGTHNFLGENNPNIDGKISKRLVEDGTHNFLDGETQRKSVQKRVAEGTYHLLKRLDGTSLALDQVKKGTHNLLSKNRNTVSCPYCFKIGDEILMKRWHFSNCKINKVVKW